MKRLEKFLATKDTLTNLHEDVIDPRDAESIMFRWRFKRGLYSCITDLRSYLPFLHLPQYLLYKYLIEEQWNKDADGKSLLHIFEVIILNEIFLYRRASF